jgi:hypothetical protein
MFQVCKEVEQAFRMWRKSYERLPPSWHQLVFTSMSHSHWLWGVYGPELLIWYMNNVVGLA